MNILITGASGFVGSNLINLFKKNKKINLVCVSTREKSEIINKNIRWIKINNSCPSCRRENICSNPEKYISNNNYYSRNKYFNSNLKFI